MRIEEALKNIKAKIKKAYKNYEYDGQKELPDLYKEERKLNRINYYLKPLKDPIINAIRDALDMRTGENFKMQVTFQELIDYKTNDKKRDDNEKFKRFVVFIDSVQTQLKFVYPFIDLSGVDLSWTTNQLIDYVLDAYFLMPTISIKEVKTARVESNTESIAENAIKNMLIKVDTNDN